MKADRRQRALQAVLGLILALGVFLPACSAQDNPKEKSASATQQGSLARVNGKDITEADVKAKAAEQFAQMERQYEQQKRELLENGIDQVIEDRLLEAEAAARKVTKEQILADLKPAAVTDADVDAFYEQNKAQIPRPKDQVAGQIKTYLESQRQSETRQKFYDDLRAKYKVEYLLEPTRVEVAATGPSMGPENAPITIVEFSDFECPFCSRLLPTMEQVKQKYGDKVRLVFRQYPLNFHQHAQKAAEASLCANEQGKFWEFHDAMFQNQKELAVEQLKAKAAAMGMNAEQFNSCLDGSKFAAQVKKDFDEGSAAGVSGTPAMFVNGRFISGAVPFQEIAKVIDDELNRKGQNTASK